MAGGRVGVGHATDPLMAEDSGTCPRTRAPSTDSSTINLVTPEASKGPGIRRRYSRGPAEHFGPSARGTLAIHDPNNHPAGHYLSVGTIPRNPRHTSSENQAVGEPDQPVVVDIGVPLEQAVASVSPSETTPVLEVMEPKRSPSGDLRA